MNKQLFFTLVLLFSFLNINAQFTGDFENYTAGEPICSFDSNAAWQAWCTPLGEGCCMMATSDQACTGIISGEIPGDGTTSALLNLGNKIFGTWCLYFYMYVPSNKEASFNIQGQIPPIGSGQSVVGNINFNKDISNSGVGYIDWDTSDPTDDTYFNFSHDEWFLIYMRVDMSMGISMATWQFGINSTEIVPVTTPFANGNGVSPSSLGGINFPSTSTNNLFYLDDFLFLDSFVSSDCLHMSTDEIEIDNFSIYPNPSNKQLVVQNDSNVKISSIKIFNLLGDLIIEEKVNFNTINIEKLKPGTYILKIETKKGTVSKKVVKI